jgi:hypothetical protein
MPVHSWSPAGLLLCSCNMWQAPYTPNQGDLAEGEADTLMCGDAALDLESATLKLDQDRAWDALWLEVSWFDGNAAVLAELDPTKDTFDISGLAPAYTGTILQSAVYSDALTFTLSGENSDGTSCVTRFDSEMIPMQGMATDGWMPPAGAGLSGADSGALTLDRDEIVALLGSESLATDSLILRVDNGLKIQDTNSGLNQQDAVTGRAYLHFPFTGDIPMMNNAFHGAYIEFVPQQAYPDGAEHVYPLVDVRLNQGQGYAVFQGFPGFGQSSHGLAWTFRDGYAEGSGQDLEDALHNGRRRDRRHRQPSRGARWQRPVPLGPGQLRAPALL